MDLKVYQEIYNKERFAKSGLNNKQVEFFRKKYGKNYLEKKKNSIFSKIIKALFEPMIIILLFAWIITFAVCITNSIQGKSADYYECIGIFISILVSVGLTVIMEGKSEKAFEALQKYSNSVAVKVTRNNENITCLAEEIVVGDLITYEAGDKIVSDGLVIDCVGAELDESTLTGESRQVVKRSYTCGDFKQDCMVFSGTYVKSGQIKCLSLAVGEQAQTGKIASGLQEINTISAPLSQKLSSLSKKISIFGGISALFVFILTILRLFLLNGLNFENFKNAFLDAIVLIVAAVPEGLPATVAISLALSVVKLAKSNAIIKKLIAVETVGSVSVICSDKTGTLTTGKMIVNGFVQDGNFYKITQINNKHVKLNVALNSTATFIKSEKDYFATGNFTEQALIKAFFNDNLCELERIRSNSKLINRIPFSSANKYMVSTVFYSGEEICYYKGSIEKILEICALNEQQKEKILSSALKYERNAERLLAFAHSKGDKIMFDGYCTISDEIRNDVVLSVAQCKKAGIEIKILTGDNKETALAVAKKLALPHGDNNAVTCDEIERLSDEKLGELLKNITIIARSTPDSKLRIVNLLKKKGYVVAVTGDGVNDAPAIKNADIGIAMGDGSDVTKESSDIILLDNSFSVIVQAITFGRNIYRNFQRFIFFQLTVNISAVLLIISFLLLGFESPFTTIQLLWINVIMDGPLALSLGLEHRVDNLLEEKPVKRTDSLLNKKTFIRTLIHAFLITAVILVQKLYNFLNLGILQNQSAVFCLFVVFQLFNAVNARELGVKSILKTLGKNKPFSVIFVMSLAMQIIINEFLCKMFNTYPLGISGWAKIVLVCLSIILFSEIYKLLYKKIVNNKFFKKIIKRSKFA